MHPASLTRKPSGFSRQSSSADHLSSASGSSRSLSQTQPKMSHQTQFKTVARGLGLDAARFDEYDE